MDAKKHRTQGHPGDVQGQGQAVGCHGANEGAHSEHENGIGTLLIGNDAAHYSADEESQRHEWRQERRALYVDAIEDSAALNVMPEGDCVYHQQEVGQAEQRERDLAEQREVTQVT